MAGLRLNWFIGPVNQLVVTIASVQGVLPWTADEDIVSFSSQEMVFTLIAEELPD
jgi:hypothetical protein